MRVSVLDLGHVELPEWHPRAAEETCLIQGYVIHHPDGAILVDTGVGSGNDLIDDLYSPTTTNVVDALHSINLDEREIVAIVNSHLHFDHCGQNAAFPAVPVCVQAAELEAATLPRYTIREWAEIEPSRQRVLDGDAEIAPGVTVLATPGHTPGHQSVLVENADGTRRLLAGQCCYTCAEFAAGQIDPPDLHDPSWAETGRASLDRLRKLDADVVHLAHDPTVLGSDPNK